MATVEEIRQNADHRSMVRKIQKAYAFLLPTTAPLPTSLYTTGSLTDFSATPGAISVGLVSPDGWTFAREIETEDINALGYGSPVRTDITTVPRSVTVTALESNRKEIQELKYGTVITETQDAATGEVVFDEPDLPNSKEYRLIVVGADGPADEEWIMGKGFPAVKLTGTGEEVWGQEGAVSQELTFSVFSDDETGAPVRHYLGGTGAVRFKDVLGYTQAV